MDINTEQKINLSIINNMCIDEHDIFKSMDMMIDIVSSDHKLQIEKINDLKNLKKQKSKKIKDLPEIIEEPEIEPEPIILTPIVQDEEDEEDDKDVQ